MCRVKDALQKNISVDITDRKSYHGSVFVGNTTNTENDNSHRSVFSISAIPDSGVWHDLKACFDIITFYNYALKKSQIDSVPDNTLTTNIRTDDKVCYYYSVHKSSDDKTKAVIEPSKLKLITSTEDLSPGFLFNDTEPARISDDETYHSSD